MMAEWKNAPDTPGLWIGRYPDGIGVFYSVTAEKLATYKWEHSTFRYYGPVPFDSDAAKI